MRCSRRVRAQLFALLALAAAIAMQGCGGEARTVSSAHVTSSRSAATSDPKPPPASARALSSSELIAKGTAACRLLLYEVKIGKVDGGSTKEIAKLAPRNAAVELSSVKELTALKPPKSLEHAWRQIVKYRQTLAEELAALGRAAKRNDQAAMSALIASKKHVHKLLRTVARRAGMEECAVL